MFAFATAIAEFIPFFVARTGITADNVQNLSHFQGERLLLK